MWVYHYDELVLIRYRDLDFQSNKDSCKSISSYVFILSGETISWRSVKQSCIIDLIMEVEYGVASKVEKDVVWLRKFLMELRVVILVVSTMILFYDNSETMT